MNFNEASTLVNRDGANELRVYNASDDGIIVCEHDISEKISDEYFEIFDEKRYGSTGSSCIPR